jgi:hypothetical protein
MPTPDGHRWIRGYRPAAGGLRYTLWEQRHGRPSRVGTARTRREANAFLGVTDLRHTWVTVRVPILTGLAAEQVTDTDVEAAQRRLVERLADALHLDAADVEVLNVGGEGGPLSSRSLPGDPRRSLPAALPGDRYRGHARPGGGP